MKNLNKLCLVLSVGSIFALSISACSDDPAETNNNAGTSSGGTATAGTSSGGTATAGTGTAGTGTAGTGTAGTGTAGTGTAGTGTAGTATGGSGGSGGASGGSGGSGGKAGAGGTGGSGGASGGSGGSAGGGGGPSADCAKWCNGPNGVVTFCAGKGLAPNVDTNAKCIAHCTAPEAAGNMGLSCWNTHLTNAVTGPVGDHCKHASGAADQNVCNKTN